VPRDHRKNMQLMMFSDFGLAAPILQALRSKGYNTPTPIQAKAIPTVLTGRDMLGSNSPPRSRKASAPTGGI
jgi:superfamily II DNA/RNA helicase